MVLVELKEGRSEKCLDLLDFNNLNSPLLDWVDGFPNEPRVRFELSEDEVSLAEHRDLSPDNLSDPRDCLDVKVALV